MKKLSIIILALFCIAWQGKAQSCFNVYQGETVLKSIPTSEVDSIGVSETAPHIVSFWQNGSVLQSYYTDEVDSITVVNDADPWSYTSGQPLFVSGLLSPEGCSEGTK